MPIARGDSHEETVVHAVHECLESREVWSAVARTWEATMGEPLDVSNPTVTVFGLRPRPDPSAPAKGLWRGVGERPLTPKRILSRNLDFAMSRRDARQLLVGQE